MTSQAFRSATRKTWVKHVGALKGLDVIIIHPREDLTAEMVAQTIRAGKLNAGGAINIYQHGNRIMLQRAQERSQRK